MRVLLRQLAPALFVLLSASLTAKADTMIFSIVPSGSNSIATSGGGAGEQVTFGSAIMLDAIAFDLNLATGGTLKYFIYDSTDTAAGLLFSSTQVLAASSTPSFIKMTFPLFNLSAGTYFFGAVSDSSISLQESDGSTAAAPFYSGFAAPTALLNLNNDTALQLFSPSAATPEPGSIALLGTGMLGAFGVARRRFVR